MKTLAIFLVLILSACAQDRYLTQEADDAMREACAKDGCVVVPKPVFKGLVEELNRRKGERV